TSAEPLILGARHRGSYGVVPQFKVMLESHHRPACRGFAEALRRRLHLIPFAASIPPAERDRRLMAALRGEHPAILRWAIEGAAQWHALGLGQPATLRQATE